MADTIKGRVLVVDDDESVGAYYQKVLERAGFVAEAVASLGAMRTRLTSVSFDIVLLDLNLGEENGFDGLATILKEAPFTKVFVLTANGTVPRAVDAMRRGATGFFEKGGDVGQLLTELVNATSPDPFGDESSTDIGLIGRSPALLAVVDKVRRLKDVDSMILLLGESGTGKEVIARAIHRTSARGKERFDAINCGAIPENLLESELFGHRKGSFTDAKADRKGIFEMCSEGTLLLDEIGDMPLSLQMKLLRVLQEREVMPVGATSPVKINTRVIAATHRDILAEARAKRFREDLYFRLSIVVLHIPTLRERREDIPLLIDHFLGVYNRRFGRAVRPPNAGDLARMMAYDWPGNVRELQNSLERSVVLAEKDEIDIRNVFAHLSLANSPASFEKNIPDMGGSVRGGLPEGAPARFPEFGNGHSAGPGGANYNGSPTFGAFADSLPADAPAEWYDLPLTEAKQAFERRYLERQLSRCNGMITEVAARSGRYRADVYRLMTRYGIDHGTFRH